MLFGVYTILFRAVIILVAFSGHMFAVSTPFAATVVTDQCFSIRAAMRYESIAAEPNRFGMLENPYVGGTNAGELRHY